MAIQGPTSTLLVDETVVSIANEARLKRRPAALRQTPGVAPPLNGSPKTAARHRRRREELLRVAAELFAERGFAGTSTTDIADALGIKGGSIYYYIESKEALLFELMEDIYGLLLDALEHVLTSDAPTLDKLGRLIDLHVTGMAEHRDRGALILNEARSLGPEHRAVVDRHAATYENGLADIIVQGQKEGVIDPTLDPKVVTKALLGAGNWINRWYREGGAWSPADISRQYARIFLSGLAPGAVPAV
jgi:AcrR family transcriptional regulator